MPRRYIQFVKGNYYHIYNRGAGRQSIFRKHEDYRDLLLKLKEVSHECEISVIAYCLLPNHYHWLVRQDGDTLLSKVSARVFGSYSQTFNLRYGRSGTLFEGPFQAIPVGNDEYLRQLCLYIHANAVLHGIANAPQLWPYSNYHEWMNLRNGTLVDHSFVKEHFGSPRLYSNCLQDYLSGKADMPDGLKNYLDSLDA